MLRTRSRSQAQRRSADAAGARAREQIDGLYNDWARRRGLVVANPGQWSIDAVTVVLTTARSVFGGCESVSLFTVEQLGGEGPPHRTAASTGRAANLDAAQLVLGEGPGMDAVDLDMLAAVRDLGAPGDTPIWARFDHAAKALGIHSYMSIAVPWTAWRVGLHPERRALGAINFYAPQPHAFGQPDRSAMRLGAWAASILSGRTPGEMQWAGF